MAEMIRLLPDPEPVPDIVPEIPPAPPPDPSRLTPTEQRELQQVLEELANRDREALALYEPTPMQEAFHASHAPERINRGGNRGGKTLAVCVEIARALTGQDPHDKYAKEDLRFIAVGKDLRHCSKVLYRKLFKRGAFKIIKDKHTKKWRTFRPDDPRDVDRADDARPAPPLIPARFVVSISWDNKREEIPTTIKLVNGSELTFFSSLGAPPQGWDADCALFDEEIESPLWYPEVSARLIDRRQYDRKLKIVRNGKFIWSATPQAGTQLLYELITRAEKCRDEPSPGIVEFRMNMGENPFISEGGKAEFAGKFDPDSDEYRIRVLGDFALAGQRVYPTFQPKGCHGLETFEIPDNWTRYAFLDPGAQVTAVLFVAIPHPEHELAGHRIIYDELYIKRCDAVKLAERMQKKLLEGPIEAWWIDHRAGRMTQIASGKTVEQQYSEEFEKLDVRCNRTGHKFGWASDDVEGGILAVKDGLVLVNGRCVWRVMYEKVPEFVHEASIYSYKKLPTGMVTDQPLKVNDHLMDDWRYAALANLKWVKPKPQKKKEGYTNRIIAAKKAKALKGSGWGSAVRLG